MTFKIGDKVIIDDLLNCYDANLAGGKRGVIVGHGNSSQGELQSLARNIPGVTPQTKVFYVKVGHSEWSILDIHMSLDVDSLPYDEWVRRRDWNKIYKNKSDAILRGSMPAPSHTKKSDGLEF